MCFETLFSPRKLACVFSALALSLSAETLSFIGKTDKNPLEYALNETMTFTVTLVDTANGNAAVTGKNLRWTLTDDNGQSKDGTATSDSPLVVTHAMTAPGFTRLKVEVQTNGTWLTGNTEYFDGGAGADVDNILEYAAPSDLASFWQAATNLLYATPFTGDYAPVYTNIGTSGGVEYYHFELPMPNDTRPATGLVGIPVGASAKQCGIIAQVDGYGFGSTGKPASGTVLSGSGYIVAHITRHGEYPLADAAYYTSLQNNEMKSFCFRNNDTGDAKDTDFYKMLMRDLRALQFLKTFKEWNGTYIKTTGGSMGGYQSIGMASLDKDVTECVASIPWCADLSGGAKFGRMTGWRPAWTETLGYVDLKNLAKLCTAKVTISSAGLGDYVCPPSGEVLLYKSLSKPKKITYVQNMGHGSTHGPNSATYSYEDADAEPEPEPEPVTRRTLNWIAGNGNWSVATNWKDADGGTNAVPRDGDAVAIKQSVNNQNSNNDLTGLKPYSIGITGGFQWVNGNPVTFTKGSYGINNGSFMYFGMPLVIEGTNMTINSTSFLVLYYTGKEKGTPVITSATTGEPCGIVKTGSGSAGEQCYTALDYTGFKFIRVEEGAWCFNVNGSSTVNQPAENFPSNLEIVFAKAGAHLMVGGNSTVNGLTLHEEGTAVGGYHTIKSQNDAAGQYGTLTITGTPALDNQVFTGTIAGKGGFVWAPASNTKTFTFKGGVSANTGKLGVRNGTLRLTDGASFTALSELEVSGGANTSFVVSDSPSKALKASKLTIGTGSETISLPTGMTLAVETLTIAGARMSAGTYTKANAAWITGDGSVTVAGQLQNQPMVWCGAGGDGLWSNANNWTNALTGAHETPFSGDTLEIGLDAAVTVDLAVGTTLSTPKLNLATAGVVLTVPAGVTLVATEAYIHGARIPAGTYTSAAWLKGGGTVRVETTAACHLKWSGSAGDKKWSSANNWINQSTGLPDVPRDGDTLTLASGGDKQINDIVGLKPYKIIPAGSGAYSNPGGNALIFEEGSWGIENGGYMYYQMPTIVRAKKITMYCSSNAGYTTGIYNDQGNTFGFEKTGSGLFAFKTGNGSKFTGLKDITLTAGLLSFGWQGTFHNECFPPGIEVTFNGENTKLLFDQNTIFTNFVIRETAKAIGKTHNISEETNVSHRQGEKTFTITGAPALSPMTYTGDILSPMSFAWAPTNDWNTFVFNGQEVTSTNTITAAGGVMRLEGGASFTKLGRLVLKGGALTTFEVVAAPTKTFHVKNLVLETGLETIRTDIGVKLYFDTLTVNGETKPAGVYVQTGRIGTQVSWAKGGGYICVGGADMPEEPTGDTIAATWTAGGTDAKLSTGANWQGGATPDLDTGLVAATFAKGAGAALDRVAKFKSISLDAPGNWAFTKEDGDFYAFLGSGGLTTSGKGHTYTLGWPTFLWSNQFWTIGKGDAVAQNALVDGNGACLVVRGGGTLDCNATMGGVGHVVITNATVNLNADDAFGSSETQVVDVDMASSKIYFNGVTVNRTIRNSRNKNGDNCIYVKAGTDNVLNGDLDVSLAVQNKINMEKNSSLRIKGHVKRATTAWFTFGGSGDAANRSTVYLDSNTEIVTGSALQCNTGLNIYFNAPSNQLGNVWFWFNQNGSTLHTTVPYAFVRNAGGTRSIMKSGNANAEWNLHGCDQELEQWGVLNNAFRVTSEKQALLHIVSDYIYYTDSITNAANFTGGSGFSFEGSKYVVLNGACSSTGIVQVTKGELTMTANAKWPNASAAVVKGGKLSVAKSTAFGTNTVFNLSSSGKLNLAAGVKIKTRRAPVFNGVEATDRGTYGSTSSNAEYRNDDYFSGEGVIKFGPRLGTIVILR